MMTKESPFIDALIDQEVTNVWFGHGSAIFVEFGELTQSKLRSGKVGQAKGKISLMIEWSWRIEKVRSILCGSWSDESKWEPALKNLLNSTVTGVSFSGYLPEITISFSKKLRVTSFMTSEGQPAWAIMTKEPNLGTLCVKRGALCVEES